MQHIHFTGDIQIIEKGASLLAQDLNIFLSEDGIPVHVVIQPDSKDSLVIISNSQKATIEARDKAAFFRALGILCARGLQNPLNYSERRHFDKNGIMVDCSRNAVASVQRLLYILRKMALMGHSWAMLYTEETYPVAGEPFFGYCRGRYSEKELLALDDYADALGIELVPCIQTLSHLENFLTWPAAEKYRDTQVTMMVGNENVYDLIERMVASVSSLFRTRRIHIGMDEAWDLGRGNLLTQKGYTPPAALMAEHLKRVHEITQRHGLHAMMWSDMHFENAGPGGYYGIDKHFSKEILESAPEDIDLVYWDYFHERESEYDRMLCNHELFSARTIFAGGIWTWSGIMPDYRKTKLILGPAMHQCVQHGIREVFATAWGDNGGECPLSTVLLGMQMFAEFDYGDTMEDEIVDRRFKECTGMNAAMIKSMTDLQYPVEYPRPETGVLNLGKLLLYEDPLIPFFEKDIQGENMTEYYAKKAAEFKRHGKKAPPEIQHLPPFYASLSHVLSLKCRWRMQATQAVSTENRERARELVLLAKKIEKALLHLEENWRIVWMTENKPFGFEVVDGRIGWQVARFRTAAVRMQQFADGTLDTIPELLEEKKSFLCMNNQFCWTSKWGKCVSACHVNE